MRLNPMQRVFISASLLLPLAALMIGFQLGKPGLWTDESIYAQTAREMARSGDWVTPTLCGRPYLIKPPLFPWLASAAFHLLGENELAARLPQALAGLAAVLATGGLAGSIFCKRWGWLAGAALLTSPGFLIGSRVAGMDVLLTTCTLLSLASFYRGYRLASRRRPWFLLAGFFAGLGMLAKGPLGIFVPSIVILIFLLLRGELRLIFSLWTLEGLLLALVTAALWYLPVWFRHPVEFTHVFWVGNNLARISEPVSQHSGPLYFYIPVFLLAFLPWSLPFVVALFSLGREIFRAGMRSCDPADLFLLLWFVVPFLFFSSIATKLPGYLLPIFPAAGLLFARRWEEREGTERRRRAGGPFPLLCALGALSLPGTALAVPYLLEYRYELRPERIWLFPLVTFVAGAGAALLVLMPRGKFRGGAMVLAAAIFAAGLVPFVVLPVEPFESMKEMTVKLLKKRQAGYPVALAGPQLKGTLFYTGCSVPDPRDLNDLPRPGPALPLYCLVKDRYHDDLEGWSRRYRFHLEDVRREGSLALVEVRWE